ncbi:hypothetical protein BCR42DRAFT_424019 [Absidia repens]|uniref:Uncharacterized protein n=1 Tax=Absidia repens TaxID=90262 RepID=A0A1X2I4L5_9FUNG|nr:hypothetical protein BCR42DRAFT_424019 [Absidia repens]
MYFSLPTSQERSQQQSTHVEKTGLVDTLKGPAISSCAPLTTATATTSSNMNYLTDERLLEIVENLEDHWRSPPILTPTTLAMIFNNGYSDTSSPSRSNSICEKVSLTQH